MVLNGSNALDFYCPQELPFDCLPKIFKKKTHKISSYSSFWRLLGLANLNSTWIWLIFNQQFVNFLRFQFATRIDPGPTFFDRLAALSPRIGIYSFTTSRGHKSLNFLLRFFLLICCFELLCQLEVKARAPYFNARRQVLHWCCSLADVPFALVPEVARSWQ